MKRLLLTLLVVALTLGVVGAVGFTGYRFGYARGAQTIRATADDETLRPPRGPFNDVGPRGFPGRNFGFDRDFHHGFGMRGFHMRGFGFFSPLMFLGWILVLGLIASFLYWLFTRSGWRLTRTAQTTVSQTQPVETIATEVKEEKGQTED